MSLFKKLVLVGVFSAVISLGLAGAGTASADGDHHGHGPDCWLEATNSPDPACWQYFIWGGVANGWIPRAPFIFANNPYYFYNYSPYYNFNPYFYNPYLYNPYVNYGWWMTKPY